MTEMRMRCDWNKVWDSFDRRKKAKANDTRPEAAEGEDMFSKAGVAAE